MMLNYLFWVADCLQLCTFEHLSVGRESVRES